MHRILPASTLQISTLTIFLLLFIQHGNIKGYAQNQNIQPTQELAIGKAVEIEINGGEIQSFQTSLDKGMCLNLFVEQIGIDLVIEISSSDGSMLARIDRPSGSNGNERVLFVAEKSGKHHISIQSLRKNDPKGKFRISLIGISPATERDFKWIKAEQLVSDGEVLRANLTSDSLTAALEKFEQGLSIWRELDERYEQAVTNYGIGWTYNYMSNYGSAIKHFRTAAEIMHTLRDTYGEAINLAGLAWAEMYLGDLKSSEKHFQQSTELYPDDTGLNAGNFLSLGTIYYLQNENQKALGYLRQSLELRRLLKDKRREGLAFIIIGKVYAKLMEYDTSQTTLQKAIGLLREVKSVQGEADAVSTLGWIYLWTKQYKSASSTFQTALQLRKEAGDRTGEASTLFGLASSTFALNDLYPSLEYMKASLAIIESLRSQTDDIQLRTSFFATVQSYYEFYIRLLMKLHEKQPTFGYNLTALEANERARARVLLELLVRSQIGLHNYGMNESAGISAIDNKTEVKTLSVTEIQTDVLDEDTALLSYSLGEENSFLWVVTKTKTASYKLPEREVIESVSRKLYNAISARNRIIENETLAQRQKRIDLADKECKKQATELSRLILLPAYPLPKVKRLLVVLQGNLQYTPLSLLPEPTSSKPQKTFPLLMKYEIVETPSVSIISILRKEAAKRKPALKTLAVFGDPVFSLNDRRVTSATKYANAQREIQVNGIGNIPLERLDATKWEAEGISEKLSADQKFIALNFAANRQTFFSVGLEQYRILHFATHSIIDDTEPNRSGIVLSLYDEKGNAIENGVISSADISNLSLNADLVVLSACRTGLGKNVSGEGLLSLTRSFMYAGASRAVVSLWEVQDQATGELMVRFYNRLFSNPKQTPSNALREAQLSMLKDARWHSPYYWASFVLQGEWK